MEHSVVPIISMSARGKYVIFAHTTLTTSGIIFVAKDPDLNPALNTTCNIYHIELSSFEDKNPPKPVVFPIAGYEGAASSPVFSRDGSKAAFLKMKKNGYEADRNDIFLVLNVKVGANAQTVQCQALGDDWDRSPAVRQSLISYS